jgi:hypothetical protein
MMVDSETEFVNACRSQSPERNLQPDSEKGTAEGALSGIRCKVVAGDPVSGHRP